MKTETRDVGGLTFHITQLGGWKGIFMLRRLTAAFAPALGVGLTGIAAELSGSGLREMLNKDVGRLAAAFGPALPKLFESLTEAELKDISKGLLEPVSVQYNGAIAPVLQLFDNLFAGAAGSVLQLLMACVEVNYGDFFGDLAARAMAVAASRSKDSQSTSSTPGLPGDS